jgi:hypothetical protein
MLQGRAERRSDDPLSAFFPADSGHEARECLADAVERAAAGAVKRSPSCLEPPSRRDDWVRAVVRCG